VTDEKGTWKRFHRLKFDSRTIAKQAKQASTRSSRHARKFVVAKLSSLRNARRHIITWLVIVGGLIGAVALQTMWYQQAYRTTVWGASGTYAEGVLGPIDTLNPLYATTDAELSAARLLFSSLYQYDKTGQLGDDLATSTSISKDERSYTITLRNDVKWSDGKPLTAADVVFTVDLMKSPDVRSAMQSSWTDITATAVDAYTVRFVLPARYAAFSHALTFAVLPKHILDSVPAASIRQNTFSISPTGSGPFTARLLQLAPGGTQKIANLVANEKYYRGTPLLSRFTLHAYDSSSDITNALLAGEVNAAIGTDIVNSKVTQSFTSRTLPVNSGVYAVLNTSSDKMKDIKLRRALQLSTDTAKVQKAVGYKTPALWLPFVQGQLYGSGIPKPPQYSTAQATKMLKSAGWKYDTQQKLWRDKAKQPLTLTVATVKNTTYERAVNELARQWKAIGIDVIVKTYDTNDPTQDFVQRVLQPREYDVLVYKLEIGGDPDVYAYWHSSQASSLGYNFSNYRNDISDDALASARARNDNRLRNEKYKDFAKQWLSDVPAIGLYQPVEQYVFGKSVHPELGGQVLSAAADRYSTILYWSASQETVYKTP